MSFGRRALRTAWRLSRLDKERVTVVCNHELTNDNTFPGPYGLMNELAAKVPEGKLYDAGKEGRPSLGGTSTFVYHLQRREVESHFLSLAGTERNCAGGPTPWGSWISCEETTVKAGDDHNQHHGYNFEVPATANPSLCDPIPLKAMGRFRHEAVAVDPATGIVYQTEDEEDGLITRFLPGEPGNLQAGGRLGSPRCESEEILRHAELAGFGRADDSHWPADGS